MVNVRRLLAFTLSGLVLISAPGLPAYCAAGEALDAASASGADASSWIPVLSAAAFQIGALPDFASQNISGIMGQIQLEAALHPRSAATLAFTAKLPAQADTPEKLAALPESARAQILSRAVGAASAQISAQAAPLIARFSNPGAKPASADEKAISRVASLWFYLPPAQAAAARALAGRHATQSAVERARGMAQALIGKAMRPGDATADPEVDAGIKMMFARIKPRLAPYHLGEQVSVRDVLAPEAVQALAQASRALDERGKPRGALWTAFLTKHRGIFGVLADKKTVETLRHSGQWTELASAITLAAAGQLAQEDDETADEVLRQAGLNHDFFMLIPAWHPLAGRFETLADAFSSYGPPHQNGLPGSGLRLGRPFGIPVVVRPGALFAMAAITAETGWAVAGTSHAHLLVSLAAGALEATLCYAALLAHELGHALVAKAAGLKVRGIVVTIMGGAARYWGNELRAPFKNFLIAFAGPAVNLALAAACFLPALFHVPVPQAVPRALTPFILANLVIALVNLPPMLPLDGGRMLRATLSGEFSDDYAAARLAERIGKIIAIALAATAVVMLCLGLPRLAAGVGTLAVMGFLLPHPIAHPGTTTVEQKQKQKND